MDHNTLPAPDPSPVTEGPTGYGLSQDRPSPRQRESSSVVAVTSITQNSRDLSGPVPGVWPPGGLIWHRVSWEGTSSSSQVGLKMGPGPGRRRCVSRVMTLPGPLGREGGRGLGQQCPLFPSQKQPPCPVPPPLIYIPLLGLKPPLGQDPSCTQEGRRVPRNHKGALF